MRRFRNSGSFLLSLLLNILLNPEGLIGAAIALGLHFWLGISLWWSILILGLWLGGIVARMCILRWVNRCSTPDTPRPNKNPYSVK